MNECCCWLVERWYESVLAALGEWAMGMRDGVC